MNNNELNSHNQHCLTCYKTTECNYKNCKIIECLNRQCKFKFHECKLDEHLNEVCMYQFIDCNNKSNGCKLQIKRGDMGNHLNCCVASVIRCSSFRLRNLCNRNEKYNQLKWPCPIAEQLEYNTQTINSISDKTQIVNINDVLLKQDYKNVVKFAADFPLMFHRLYGYLIGLDVSADFSRGRFNFLRKILKNVKSKIFSDIEAENCVILNDEVGCLSCQYRIRHLEMKRFRDTRSYENRIKFYSVLGELDDYNTFIEEKIYMDPKFLKIYNKVYLNEPKPEEPVIPLFSQDEINNKLLQNNKEILQVLELNGTLKVNVTKEMSCESFAEYESYRLRETTFSSECDQLLRRDEFSQHYSLFHDFLLPNADQIDFSCPFRQYGCRFFHRKFDFIYGSSNKNRKSVRSLVENDLTNCVTLKRNDSIACFLDDNNNNSLNYNNNNNVNKTLMELPFEVMYVIIDNLDSISLYNLSMTCKVIQN